MKPSPTRPSPMPSWIGLHFILIESRSLATP